MNESLLIELCTEELPPKSLSKLSASFCASLTEVLLQNGLITAANEWQAFASPRRLGLLVKDVAAQQQDRSQQRKGPALQAAYDDTGEPSKAAMGFARSCGVEVADLLRTNTEQGTWLTFEQNIKGNNVTAIAQQALDIAIKNLPIAKRMRWGNSTEEFVRPVHKLLALHGSKVIGLSAFGLSAGNQTLGHRFHCPQPIEIDAANDYETILLEQGKVVANFEKRKDQIRRDAQQLANSASATVVFDDDLLEEVTGLVEWPVTIIGEFDTDFLKVPTEALVASMKDHQKYFHLVDDQHQLLPYFITVSNIESQQPGRVVSGNERVLRARLADGMFFWEQDKATTLASKGGQLGGVLFHLKLGSVADKVKRISDVAQFIGEQTGADIGLIKQAASLCKNDLVTAMVGEFPSLQGTMGRYYALHDGQSTAAADAIEQHYWPKFSGDKLAESAEAIALAMADRTDTLVGIFATGEKPTGVKDPYALRRASLGIIRMLIDKQMDISLQDLLARSMASYGLSNPTSVALDQTTQDEINQFVLDRLRAFYLAAGFSANEFNAVAACHPARAIDFDRRIRAIKQFYAQHQEEATSLAAANKRIANILRKTDYEIPPFDSAIADQEAEQLLAKQLAQVTGDAQASFDKKDYASALTALASLRPAVDHFFDDIMVMDEDKTKRNNRLALLQQLRGLFMQVADISHLVIEK